MAGERPGQTLQPTALVHEAYLKLAGEDGGERRWNNRSHFLAAAAEAMRRILIDRARRKQAVKRGGDQVRTTWNESKFESGVDDDEVLAVDEALGKLEADQPELAAIVKPALLRGIDDGRDRRRAGAFSEHDRAQLADCPGLVVPGDFARKREK